MVSGVRTVQIKWREFTKEVIWGTPNLYVRLLCHSNIPIKFVTLKVWESDCGAATYFPSGENWIVRTEL